MSGGTSSGGPTGSRPPAKPLAPGEKVPYG